jgi:HK97 family phage portal protein
MFEAIKQLFATKESAAGRVIFRGTRHAQWSKRNYKAFAEEGYQKNNVANAAINKIASAVGSTRFMLKDAQGKEISNHPLLDLLRRPNPLQSGSQFLRAVTGFYLVAGNAYIERTIAGGTVRELYPLRSDRMIVIPSDTGLPRGYAYKVGQDQVMWEADPQTGVSDIRHIKAWHPLDDWYGLSPIEAGAYAVDQHNEGMKWLQGLLQNSAAPSGVMRTEGDLSDEQFNRLKAEMDEKYTGGKNAGRPLLLEGGLQWQAMGMSPQQMQIIEAKHSSARDVALSLGVPPQLIGIPGDSTFSNYHEARLAFYEETVIPIMEMIAEELNAWIVPLYGQNLTLEVDLEAIPAIAEKRHKLWDMADKSSDLTINEKRAMKGYEPIDGGDVVLVQSSLVPLDLTSFDILDEPAEPDEQRARDIFALAYGEPVLKAIK